MAQDNKPVTTKKIDATAALKKDINFFSSFSSSSKNSRSYMTLFLLFLLVFIIIGSGVYAVYYIQANRIRQEINSLQAEMLSEDYQNKLESYASITNNLGAYNQQYFEVTKLFYRVAEMNKVDSKYMDVIQTNLPSDITLTDFEYTDGYILLTGLSDSYYSPLDLIANLSQTDTFTFVDITKIMQLDLTALDLTDAEKSAAKQYTFTIKGSLEANYSVKVSKMLDGDFPTPLTAVTSSTYAVGESYRVEGINTFTDSDNIYTISRVKINDKMIEDPNAFAAIKQSDTVSGTVTSGLDIVLYYTISSTNGGGQ